MKRVLSVFGTRPEAIKMCPVIKELQRRDNISSIVAVSGQHDTMLHSVLSEFGIVPDYDLKIMKIGQTLFDLTERIMLGIKNVIESVMPDIVLVHGDTTTAFASALAAFYLRIPIGHVEAGLRTYNIDEPYPEEFNRRAISVMSGIHFAPAEDAKRNLLSEGICEKKIFVTGNTVIDALKETVSGEYINSFAQGSEFVLITAHRRENVPKMRSILGGIASAAKKLPTVKFIYPLHKNAVIGSIAVSILGKLDNVILTDPLPVYDFHNLLYRCKFVITDSGGIQEEAAYLAKPLLILRNTTERQAVLASEGIKLIGTDEKRIAEEIVSLASSSVEYTGMKIFGEGNASKMIADILCNI